MESRGVRMTNRTPYVNTAGWKIAYFDGGPALGAACT